VNQRVGVDNIDRTGKISLALDLSLRDLDWCEHGSWS
jgi:hypothetical protein